MTNKPLPSSDQIISNAINHMMDKCEQHPLMQLMFEKSFVKDGYKLDWNKRLDNGEWKDKEELKGDME